MEGSNKKLSFFLILAGSVLWASWLEGFGLSRRLNSAVASSISVIVYLEPQASEDDIRELKGLFENKKEISVRSFTTSLQAYGELERNSRISGPLKAIGQEFTLPASFELSVKARDPATLGNIVSEIGSYRKVHSVEAPLEAIQKASLMLGKLNKIAAITGVGIFLSGLFLFYMSAYLCAASEHKKFLIGKEIGAADIRILKQGFYRQLSFGFFGGLLSLGVIFVISGFSGVKFHFGWLGGLSLVFGVSISCAALYIISSRKLMTGLTVFCLLLGAGISYSDQTDIDRLNERVGFQEKELATLKNQIGRYRNDLDSLTSREKKMERILDQIEKEISEKGRELGSLNKDISEAEAEIETIRNELEEHRQEGGKYISCLEELIGYYYLRTDKINRQPWFLSFLCDTVNKNYYLVRIVSEQINRCSGIKLEIERITDLENEHEQKMRDLTGLKRKVTAIHESFIARRKEQADICREIKNQRMNRSLALEQLKQEKEKLNLLVESLKKRVRNLERLSVLAEDFAAARGMLPWPADGTVDSKFGKQKHPDLDTVIFNRGIRIKPCRDPAEVKAVAGGEVVYADTFTGMRRMVVLDHGRDFYTVYADLEELCVEIGSEINPLDKLGATADCGLYFEIGRGTKPENPLTWLESKEPNRQAAEILKGEESGE
jgi:septal ring factor EnvC (AmiA/AmiB activator)